MNVLLLNASPRGEASNTLLLAKAFVRGLGGSCETVTLAEKTVAPCTGCMACWKRGDGRCVFCDDMPALLDKIMQADVIVESFPLYYFGMPAILKLYRPHLLPDAALPWSDRHRLRLPEAARRTPVRKKAGSDQHLRLCLGAGAVRRAAGAV